ncbi:hypothetical protein TRVL_08054 [Trypanosoma vivax]|nr:hypothetical protein TRVL_08054 [Trypanosoma vivax]
MNPICVLLEIENLQQLHSVRGRRLRRNEHSTGCEGPLSSTNFISCMEKRKQDVYSALARRFVHPPYEQPPEPEMARLAEEFSASLKSVVGGPLRRICMTAPEGSDLTLRGCGVRGVPCPGGLPDRGGAGDGALGANLSLDEGEKWRSCGAAVTWVNFFPVAEAGKDHGACGNEPRKAVRSFEQWDTETLASLRCVGDMINEAQKEILLALNGLHEKWIPRVLETSYNLVSPNIWPEIVYLFEDAFNTLLHGIVNLIVWCMRESICGRGGLVGRPMFAFKAFWHYSGRRAALSPSPPEFHERLMMRVKKELIWNIAPEFCFSQMVNGGGSSLRPVKNGALRERLMNDPAIVRMWDDIHFAANQKCEELRGIIEALTQVYTFYFSCDEFQQMTYQRLREIHEELHNSSADNMQSVCSGVFMINKETIYQGALSKLEPSLVKMQSGRQYASELTGEKIEAARWKTLLHEPQNDVSPACHLSSRLDTLRRRRVVQSKYDKGLEPEAHIARFLQDQISEDASIRLQQEQALKAVRIPEMFPTAKCEEEVNTTSLPPVSSCPSVVSGGSAGSGKPQKPKVIMNSHATRNVHAISLSGGVAAVVERVREQKGDNFFPQGKMTTMSFDAQLFQLERPKSNYLNSCSPYRKENTQVKETPGHAPSNGSEKSLHHTLVRTVADGAQVQDVEKCLFADKTCTPSASENNTESEAGYSRAEVQRSALEHQVPGSFGRHCPSSRAAVGAASPVVKCGPSVVESTPASTIPLTGATPQQPHSLSSTPHCKTAEKGSKQLTPTTEVFTSTPDNPNASSIRTCMSGVEVPEELPTAEPCQLPDPELSKMRLGADMASNRVHAMKKVWPFLPDMPCEGVFLEDINFSDPRLETATNRLRAVRGSASVLSNYRAIALVEDAVCEVIETLAGELITNTLRMGLRFPFLDNRMCGVLLGNLMDLETDAYFQSLLPMYREAVWEKRPTESICNGLIKRAKELAHESPYVVAPERYEAHPINLHKPDAAVGAASDAQSPLDLKDMASLLLEKDRGEMTSVDGMPKADTVSCVTRGSGSSSLPLSTAKARQNWTSPSRASTVTTSATPKPTPPSSAVGTTPRPAPASLTIALSAQGRVPAESTIGLQQNPRPAAGNQLQGSERLGSGTGIGQRVLQATTEASVVSVKCPFTTVSAGPELMQSLGRTDNTQAEASSCVKPLATNFSSPSARGLCDFKELPQTSIHRTIPLSSFNKTRSEIVAPAALPLGRDLVHSSSMASVRGVSSGVGDLVQTTEAAQNVASMKACSSDSSGGQAYHALVEKELLKEREELEELEQILKLVSKPAAEFRVGSTTGSLTTGAVGLQDTTRDETLKNRSVSDSLHVASKKTLLTTPPCQTAAVSSSSAATLGHKTRTVPTQSSRSWLPNATLSPSTAHNPSGDINVVSSSLDAAYSCMKKEREATSLASPQEESQRDRIGHGDTYSCRARDGLTDSLASVRVGGEYTKKSIQTWLMQRAMDSGKKLGCNAITDAVVKSSWGTVSNDMEQGQENRKLPSVSQAVPHGKDTAIFRKSQKTHGNTTPWGRYTLQHLFPSGYASSKLPSTPSEAPRKNSDGPMLLRSLRAHTAPECSSEPGQPPRPLNAVDSSVGIRQQYVTCCRQAGIKPNSMVVRFLPDKPGAVVSRIDTSVNYVGPKGFRPLLQIIGGGIGLEYLNLSHNNLENDEIVDLVNVLTTESGSSLRFLDLSNNPISLAGGMALLRLVQTRPSLSTVRLKGTLIPQQVCRNIQDACDANGASFV